MSVSQQLAAMIFELRSAGSPVAKAKALARAWRMIRRLSPTDRQVLAEEAGFEGAEEMLESLAAKSGGVAPALMLQLLNNVRERGSGGLSEVIQGLRNPQSRDDILLRSADAVAQAIGPEDVEAVDELPDLPVTEEHDETPDEALPAPVGNDNQTEAEPEPAIELMDIDDDSPGIEEGTIPKPTAEIEQQRPPVSVAPPIKDVSPAEIGTVDVESVVEALEAEESRVARLLLLREALPLLDHAASSDLARLVEIFPNGWARRRALTALFEGDLPADAADALDLMALLAGAADRRWCLAVVLDRFDLQEPDVERALAMVESPTLHRRILRVSGESL